MSQDKLWNIPNQWTWASLNSVGDIVAGGTPSTKEPSYWGKEVNWISPADLTGYTSKRISHGAKGLTNLGLQHSSAKVMPAGSIHFSSRAPIGYVAISAEPLATNQGFKSLVPAKGILSEFVYFYLKSAKQIAVERASGTTFLELSGTAFGLLPFPLPPTNEQRRIVVKIEQLFSELDKGIESLKTAREQLKVYRQAVLKHAFEGKLTAKWREQNSDKLEPPEQLLARIKQERHDRYLQQLQDWQTAVKAWEKNSKVGKKPGKPKALKPVKNLDKASLSKLPFRWGWFELSAIMERVQIGPFGSLLHKSDYVAGGIPLINPSHIKNQKIIPDVELTITDEKLDELSKYLMEINDIVIGRRGEMGRCAVITSNERGWLCGTGSLFVRPLVSMNPYFYSMIISSQRVKDFLSEASIGTTMQNLNEKILHGVPVPVCSRSEQNEIISEINKQYSIIEELEETFSLEIAKSETLRHSILKKAFSGQLVLQDPNDEPASVLLERIRVEKTVHNEKQQARTSVARMQRSGIRGRSSKDKAKMGRRTKIK